MLDEKALRKPGFDDGKRVVLGDGQEWTLPEYIYCCLPDYDDDGRIVANWKGTYGPEVDADLEVWLGSAEVEPRERDGAMMRVVCGLLLRNYDLDMPALQTLLKRNFSDPASQKMWTRIACAVLGVAPRDDDADAPSPKASADGSAPPSSPIESSADSPSP